MPAIRMMPLILFICISVLMTSAYGENNLASITVVNKSPLSVIGVYIQSLEEAKMLASKGRPSVGNEVYSSEIKPGDSAAIGGIEPGEYVIRIVKSNGRGDTVIQNLKPGQTFTYMIQ